MRFNLNTFKKIAISACLLSLVILTLSCLVLALIHNRSFQLYVVKQVALFSGYKIETGDIQFLLHNEIEIRVNNLKVRSIAGDKTLRILSAQIHFDKAGLLTGRVVPRKILLLKPNLQLDHFDIFKSLQDGKQLDLKQSVANIIDTLSFVSVKNGRVFVADQDMVLDDLFVDLSRSDNNPLCFTTGVRGNASYKEKNTSPYLDLKVSSSFMDLLSFKQIFPTPVVPNWIEDLLFPFFTSGQVRCDIFGIRGDLKRIRELKQPENKDVLTLKLALKHIETIKQNESFPFAGVSGEVSIENGALNVSDVKGVFGESSIRKAWFDIDSLYSNDPLYRYSIAGVFNLKDLKQQSNMDIAPAYVKEKFQAFTKLSGKLKASIQFDYKKTYDYPKLNYGTFFFSSCLMMHKCLKLPIFLNDTEIIIDENRKNRFKGQGFWGNSSFEVKGSADNIYEKGSAEVICSADINEIIKNINHRNASFVKVSKQIPGRFFLTGEKGIWSCTGEADLSGMSIDIGKFSTAKLSKGDRIAVDMAIYPKEKIEFRNIQCDIGKSFLNGSGFLGIKKTVTL